MVFYCEAAQCSSHSNKAKRLHIYPFMRGVTWVKFPKDSRSLARWKALCRRKDKFEITHKSRMCSRHFDQNQILENGFALGDPKFFLWNDFGQAVKPSRPTTSCEKRACMQGNTSSLLRPQHAYTPAAAGTAAHTVTAAGLCSDVPDIASEVVIDKHSRARPSKSSGLGCKKMFGF